MCELLPFYFDDPYPSRNLWTKELYRFRASAVDFSIERNEGFSSVLFYLGLKQALKTTDFFLSPKNPHQLAVPFSKEYSYLYSKAEAKSSNFWVALKGAKDWFLEASYPHQSSTFLLESLFRKHQRYFWRERLRGFKNQQLRWESLFFISALHSSGSINADLPYLGPDASSYHFSFLSNSSDRRSLALSPVKFFHFKHKAFLSSALYKFSINVNFRRPILLYNPSIGLNLTSFIFHNIVRCLFLLFFFSPLIKLTFPPAANIFVVPAIPVALSFTSSLSLYCRQSYYFLPKVFLLGSFKRTYRSWSVFLALRNSLLSLFRIYPINYALPKRLTSNSKNPLFRSKRLVRQILALKRRWSKRKTDSKKSLVRPWLNRLLKLRLMYHLRRKFLSFYLSALKQPGATAFHSYIQKTLFLRRLLWAWKRFLGNFGSNLFKFNWNRYLKGPLWKWHKLRRPRLFFLWKRILHKDKQRGKSPFILDVKFFLHKLHIIFLALHKASYFSSLNQSLSLSSLVRLMHIYLPFQRFLTPSFPVNFNSLIGENQGPSYVLRFRKKMHLLKVYRETVISLWILRWKHLEKQFLNFIQFTRAFNTKNLPWRLKAFYGLHWKRSKALTRNLWLVLVRISKIAYALRRRFLYGYKISQYPRRALSFKKFYKIAILPTTIKVHAQLHRKRIRKLLLKRVSPLHRFLRKRWPFLARRLARKGQKRFAHLINLIAPRRKKIKEAGKTIKRKF